jgi:ferric iron reductase protein FhuF
MTGPPRPDDAARLARMAELGAYFAIQRVAADDGVDLAALLLDETSVRDFTERTRSAIAASMSVDSSRIPLRMAASSFHLNVVARLMSPVIAAAALCGEVPRFTRESVKWLGSTGHAPQFGVTDLDWAPAPTPTRAAEVISQSVLASIVGPFNDTLASALSLSAHVSWGNAISTANGAVTVMSMARPDLEQPGRALVRALLDTESLRNTGGFTDGRFVRRSCCLFYQAPGAGLCGDCVLTASGVTALDA